MPKTPPLGTHPQHSLLKGGVDLRRVGVNVVTGCCFLFNPTPDCFRARPLGPRGSRGSSTPPTPPARAHLCVSLPNIKPPPAHQPRIRRGKPPQIKASPTPLGVGVNPSRVKPTGVHICIQTPHPLLGFPQTMLTPNTHPPTPLGNLPPNFPSPCSFTTPR